MKILITGATGFLGSHLLGELSKLKKVDVLCLIRKIEEREKIEKFKFRYILGDLKDVNSLNDATKNVDLIIHLAGEINAKDNNLYENINYKGTINLINACKKNKVKKIIYSSSIDSVYKNAYGISKLKGEEIIKNSGLNYIILRITLMYGEGDNKHLTEIAKMVKKNLFIPILGNGKYLRQPIYVMDVVDSILKSIKLKKWNKIYNIGGPDKLEFNEILNIIIKTLKVKRLKIHIPFLIGKFFLGLYKKISKSQIYSTAQIDSLKIDKTFEISESINDLRLNPRRFKDMVHTIINKS